MPDHCTTPGCEKSARNGQETCVLHTVPPDSIAPVLGSLHTLLMRLMDEAKDVEVQARYVPRIASVLIQAVRTHAQLTNRGQGDAMVALNEALQRIEDHLGPE